jgi:uncharacterized alpha-E superfamily protein
MEQLITANMATNIYWLGRHLERVEASLIEIARVFDSVIDSDKRAGFDLYQKYEIDLNYTSAVDFLHQAILGEHEANLYVIMKNARENAIISRSHTKYEAFGEMMELYNLFEKINNQKIELRCEHVDQAFSLLREIWGTLPKREHSKIGDYFFRLGKLVEEADFHVRFGREGEIDGDGMVMYEIYSIIHLLAPETDLRSFHKQSETMSQEEILDAIYKMIDTIIVE